MTVEPIFRQFLEKIAKTKLEEAKEVALETLHEEGEQQFSDPAAGKS